MFVFKEDTFQRNPSNPCPDNEFNSDVIDFIKEIRKFYPELGKVRISPRCEIIVL